MEITGLSTPALGNQGAGFTSAHAVRPSLLRVRSLDIYSVARCGINPSCWALSAGGLILPAVRHCTANPPERIHAAQERQYFSTPLSVMPPSKSRAARAARWIFSKGRCSSGILADTTSTPHHSQALEKHATD